MVLGLTYSVLIHSIIDQKKVTICGIAKGSGMIAPDMATMLVYIFTDAKISQPILQKIVSNISKICNIKYNHYKCDLYNRK